MEKELISPRPPHVLCDDIIKIIDDCIGSNQILPSSTELPVPAQPSVETTSPTRIIHTNPILSAIFPNYKHN